MRQLILQLRKFDWVLVVSTFLLIVIGVVAIYSVDIGRGGGSALGKKQLIAFAIGLLVYIFAGGMRSTLYRASALWWYVFGLMLLFLVLFFGTQVRGTTGWFSAFGFSFQPVEFMKVGVVLLFATFASRQGRYFRGLPFFIGSAVLVIVPMLLTLLQPDLGSAALMGFFWLGMMVFLKTRWHYLVAVFVLVSMVGVMGWFMILQPYQKARLMTFVDPAADPLGAGYNISQSLIAIGSGRFFGRGLGYGSQSQLRFLPESHTDFIFAVIAESFGLFGSVILLSLFASVFWRLLRGVPRAADDFGALVMVGAAVMLSAQWFVNIGATLGLLPVTGVPMPLVSYGGSSLLSVLLLLGIAQSMYASRVVRVGYQG